MAISVVMPALEMAQETGKLLAWRKKEGESVTKGEILLEIETDKAVMEIEATGDGILAGIKAQAGSEVPVGQTIAWIVKPGEIPPKEGTPNESGRRITTDSSSAKTGSRPASHGASSEMRLSPKARRLAKEQGIDITTLLGSGPDGAIVERDIIAAAEGRKTASPAESAELSQVARLMAERTSQSWTTVPHFFLVRESEAGALVETRTTLLSKTGAARPTHTDLLLLLIARVLKQHPLLNASWTGKGIRRNSEINISLAMAVEDGVVAPVIREADKLDVHSIAIQRKELAERARSGKLRPGDLSGGTFTLSNLGMYNVDAFNAIIMPPQAAILAMGRIADRVIAVDNEPAVRPVFTMTLSCDHRVVDGAKGAQFLDVLAKAVQQPKSFLD